jgi:hypothetical protein
VIADVWLGNYQDKLVVNAAANYIGTNPLNGDYSS